MTPGKPREVFIKTIRASEIGAFLYCRRAWWYQRQGVQSENIANLAAGTQLHQKHERAVIASGCTRVLASVLLLLALALLVMYAVGRFV